MKRDDQPMPNDLPPFLIDQAVRAALAEDLGRAGDLTTDAIIPRDATARAVIAARESGVIAGLAIARAAFAALSQEAQFESWVADGDAVAADAVVARIEGPARAILSAERVALNYLGRLSGVATTTAHYAGQIAHTKAKVCDTR
jgi:nicotinate-nucleotide pyrophosphorylase (carboxylating)